MEVMEVMENLEHTRRIVGVERRKCDHRGVRRGANSAVYAGRCGCALQRDVSTKHYVRLSLVLVPPLTRADVPELHCIQPIGNVSSILELGILSHERAANVPHTSVAMEEIQDRRSRVTIPGTGRKLHTYANVYINGRNKMMYKLLYGPGHEGVCVLRVSAEVLDHEGVIIADRNASSGAVAFRPSPGGLSQIMKELVFIRNWTHDDEIEQQRRGQIVCAEVLVPDLVSPELIQGAYVSCAASEQTLRAAVGESLAIAVNSDLFFQP